MASEDIGDMDPLRADVRFEGRSLMISPLLLLMR